VGLNASGGIGLEETKAMASTYQASLSLPLLQFSEVTRELMGFSVRLEIHFLGVPISSLSVDLEIVFILAEGEVDS